MSTQYYKLHTIETGTFGLDGGAMFGVVPRNLWEKAYSAPDSSNRIPMAARCLLATAPGKVILIDTGNGDKWTEKTADIYKITPSLDPLVASLAQAGYTPDDVTDVILTHLHFDHAGGATRRLGNDIVPTFANATYHIQKDHLAWARNASPKDKASFIAENYEPLLSAGCVNIIDGPGELFPGIEVQLFHGHTKALQGVLAQSEVGTVFFGADLFPLSSHVRVPYVMAYDNFPLTSIAEKESILPLAFEQEWIVWFEHDAFTPAARIALTDKGFALGEKISL